MQLFGVRVQLFCTWCDKALKRNGSIKHCQVALGESSTVHWLLDERKLLSIFCRRYGLTWMDMSCLHDTNDGRIQDSPTQNFAPWVMYLMMN